MFQISSRKSKPISHLKNRKNGLNTEGSSFRFNIYLKVHSIG